MSKPPIFGRAKGSKDKRANDIVNIILNDLLDRRGIRQSIEACNKDTRPFTENELKFWNNQNMAMEGSHTGKISRRWKFTINPITPIVS